MKEPPWYPSWRHEAFHELMEKQDRLEADRILGTWPRFDYDLEQATLTFSDGGVPKAVAEIQVVGSTGPRDWLWSWENSHWPKCATRDMPLVREFGEANGIEELTTAYLESADLNALGWELAAASVRILGAVGAYRAPRENGGAVFLLLKSTAAVS